MDIRARVEARKAELRQEQERLEAAAKARNERAREAARAEVQKRIAVLDPPQDERPPAEVAIESVNVESASGDAPTETEIEGELDAALEKRAQAMWTSGENTTLMVFFVGGIAAFFLLGWLAGLTLIVLMFIHLAKTNGKYKRQLRDELAKREGAAA